MLQLLISTHLPNLYLIISGSEGSGQSVLASKIHLSTTDNQQPLLDYDTLTIFAPTSHLTWQLIIHGFNQGWHLSIILDIINQNDKKTSAKLQIKAIASLLDTEQKYIDAVPAYQYTNIKKVPRVGQLDLAFENLVILGINKNQSKIVE